MTTHRSGLKQVILQVNPTLDDQILYFSSGSDAFKFVNVALLKVIEYISTDVDVFRKESVLALVNLFKKSFPSSRIVVLTTANEYLYYPKLFSIGVVGFTSKELKCQEINSGD